VKKTYQGTQDKSKQKFEVVGKRKLLVQVPPGMAEVWEELQAQVEQLTGHAGLRIIGIILEDEVRRRMGPPHRPDPATSCVRLGVPAGLRGVWWPDRRRTAGNRKEIPQGEGLPRTRRSASPAESAMLVRNLPAISTDEPVVDSTGPGRVTCKKSSAPAINDPGGNFQTREQLLAKFRSLDQLCLVELRPKTGKGLAVEWSQAVVCRPRRA